MINLGKAVGALCVALMLWGCTDPEANPKQGTSPSLQVGRLLGGDQATIGFARALPPADLSFPRDHGPHPEFRSEWWYLTLMLSDSQGQEYGGQFTLFRQAQTPGPLVPANPWRSTHLYMAHLAMSDVSGQRHYSDERFARGHPGLAGVCAAGLDTGFGAWLDGWELRSVGLEFLPLALEAQSPDFGWSLQIEQSQPMAKPRVLQGQAGLSAKGPNQASFYYSYTRLQVQGSLNLAGRQVSVTGSAWLDHEWSTGVLSTGQLGWEWFAVQLDDGRDLMVFRLRREDGSRDPFDHGVLVAADGTSQVLQAPDFQLGVSRYWRDDANICWPVAWSLQLLEQGRVAQEFDLEAAIDDQRMTTAVRYWEGLAVVRQAKTRVGRGYMELTGYQPQDANCLENP
jgi:predicted secreted hydrolase